jgi:hypothetical protein
MARKRPGPGSLVIDVNERFAWMRLVAALCWGGDSQRMDEALATYSAELHATLRDVITSGPQPGSFRTLCHKWVSLRMNSLACLGLLCSLSPTSLSRRRIFGR